MRITVRQGTLLAAAFITSVLIIWNWISFPESSQRIVKLSQATSLLSVALLYLTLIITPVWRLWPELPGKAAVIRARRALGVSGWAVGLLHGLLGFFGQLSGFSGLQFLASSYLVAMAIGGVALIIFTGLALTSNDFSVRYLGYRQWKLLHRLSYLATLLVVIHTLMLGTHFTAFTQIIPTVSSFLLSLLILLECVRMCIPVTSQTLANRFARAYLSIVVLLFSIFATLMLRVTTNVLSSHPQHVGTHSHESTPYVLDLKTSGNLRPNVPNEIEIRILEGETSTLVSSFVFVDNHPMRVFILDEKNSWSQTLYPTLDKGLLRLTLRLPHSGTYKVYSTFWENGNHEITVGQTIEVGQSL